MLEFVEVPQRYVVGVRRQVSAEELSDLHEHAFNETAEVLAQAQAQPGTSCCYFFAATPQVDLLAGFEVPVEQVAQVQEVATARGLAIHRFPPSAAAKAVHNDSYESLPDARQAFTAEVAQVPNEHPDGAVVPISWEEYVSAPSDDDSSAGYVTELYRSLP